MSTSLVGGPPAGFLSRVTNLERDVSFLKQKVEDDARWKHLLENWILENFAFDLRGALLAKEKGTGTGQPDVVKRRGKTKRGVGANSGGEKKVKRSGARARDESEDSEQELNLLRKKEAGMEVDVDPRDLIISPDAPSGSDEDQGPRRFKLPPQSESDYDEGGSLESGPEQSGEESSSEEEQPKKNKKMKWTLHSSYSSMDSLKESFNMRDWALWTTSRTIDFTKIYYYCKMCRKCGPGRLMLRFRSQDSDVEIYKNHLDHDHSRKNRLTDEIRSEIFNLYRAGMKNSTQIINSFKISKPDLRVPSPKQVCYVLKAQKKRERKEKKLLEREDEKKPKIKKSLEKKLERRNDKLEGSMGGDLGSVGAVRMDMDLTNLAATNSRDHFQSPHPQILSVSSGFNPPTSSLQQPFNSSLYQQHPGGYDPSSSLHQQFHSL